MSALESIRQRPVLIISILGLALLLFILTAVDRPGELFTDTHTVAKVDGEKIDYIEFQKRVEQQQEQLRQQGYTNADVAQVQQYVLQQMLNEALLKKEYQRLGLVVTDNELSHAMLGDAPHPYVNQMVQQMGVPSAQMLYDAAFNPAKNGIDNQQAMQLQQMWTALEKDTEQMLLASKFNNLFFGALTANKLDAKDYWEANASTATIAYARKDLSGVSAEGLEPTDAEINALYEQEKNRYRINEKQFVIDYITVDIVPSKEDLAAAQSDVENAIVALKNNAGVEGVEGNSKFYVDHVSAPVSKLAPVLKNNLDKITADSVAMVSFVNNKYTIAKLLGSTTSVDSVLLDLAVISDAAPLDSVLAQLNAGKKAADLGENIAQTQDSMGISLLDPSLGMMKDDILAAETGKYFTPQNNNGNNGMALRVRSRKAPVTVYEIAEITYDVVPSATTVNKLGNDLRNYVAINKSAKQFADSATLAGYNALTAVVTPSSLSVAGLPESRNAAKWTIGAKKGEVSGVFENDLKSRLMAVAVKDVYDGKFVPATNAEVRNYLTNRVLNQKKADKLVADYAGKGKSVADYAGVMGVKADTTQVTYGQSFVRHFSGSEPNLNANVAAAKKGQLVGPLALNNSVVVFEVVDIDDKGRAFDYENDAMVFNQREGAYTFQNSLFNVLLGNKKIDNRIQNFYSDRQ